MLVDLTHPITPGMSLFPGTPLPQLDSIARIDSDGYRETQLTTTSHTGTHMDAPAHVLPDGETLDRIAPERFVGTARVVDCRHCQGAIPATVLDVVPLEGIDFLLFLTGWDRYWGEAAYAEDSPYLSDALIERLSHLSLKGIGIDTLSPDAVDSHALPAHGTLLARGCLFLENLRGLDRLPSDRPIELTALPLLYANADGAPVRVVARLV